MRPCRLEGEAAALAAADVVDLLRAGEAEASEEPRAGPRDRDPVRELDRVDDIVLQNSEMHSRDIAIDCVKQRLVDKMGMGFGRMT